MTEEIKVEVSSGNVFADLGLANPEEMLIKAELASKIGEIIETRNLTQMDAAEILGLTLPPVSSRLIRKEYPDLSKQYFYGKPYFWTGAYFVASCGGVTIEQLKAYVEKRTPDGEVSSPCRGCKKQSSPKN
ncbi:MAG: XRE family transcriptional regulator [Pleurocapsa sp.]